MNKIFAIVLRLNDVRISQSSLEERLGKPVDVYRPNRKQPEKIYAGLDIEPGNEEDWRQVNSWLEACGPAVKALLGEGAIGDATLDVAYSFSEGVAAISRTVPAQSAFLAGQNAINIMVSIYPSTDI